MILCCTWDARLLAELSGAAQHLAEILGDDIVFVSLGDATAAHEAARCGAARVILVEDDLADAGADASVSALAELAREISARVVLMPADDRTAEVGPRLAERLGGAAVTQTLGAALVDGRLVWTRAAYGGKALQTVEGAVAPVVATLRRGAFSAGEPAVATVEVETRSAPTADTSVELLTRVARSTQASLEDAKVIVAGGAGVGSADAFADLEELAALLGGSVGASLAAVDAGWTPTDRQVGLTGKAVAPDVYFALGISGASQHLAGIGGAKAIVAVNTDAEASIFNAARLGVVMDCRTFVRALIEQLRSVR